MSLIYRIAQFSLTTGAADRLADFYERALGFRQIGLELRVGAAFETLMGITGGARGLMLELGEQEGRAARIRYARPALPPARRVERPDVPSSGDRRRRHARRLRRAARGRRLEREYRGRPATPARRLGSRNGVQVPRPRRPSSRTARLSRRQVAAALARQKRAWLTCRRNRYSAISTSPTPRTARHFTKRWVSRFPRAPTIAAWNRRGSMGCPRTPMCRGDGALPERRRRRHARTLVLWFGRARRERPPAQQRHRRLASRAGDRGIAEGGRRRGSARPVRSGWPSSLDRRAVRPIGTRQQTKESGPVIASDSEAIRQD